MFINFLGSLKAADPLKINNNENNRYKERISFKKFNNFNYSHPLKSLSNKGTFKLTSSTQGILNDNSDLNLEENSEKQKELVIISDKQYEMNDVIYAEGKVSVLYKGNQLKADKLIYDKLNQEISANGNVALILGDQIFRVSQLKYNFISQKGYLLNVRGSINSYTLIDDLSSNFSSSDSNKIENLLKFKKREVLNTPGKVENWLFLTDKMTINGNKWKSKKAFLSNDLLEFKQVKLAINSLEVISEEDKLRFKSSLNYLIFDENLTIPVWFGERSLTTKSEEFLDFQGSWNIGYENLDKDGYFIGRQLKPIDLSDDFVLDLEPQFLIQRSLKGYTKSFVKKGSSITSKRVKRNTSFKDYFALKSQLKGPIKIGI